MASPIVTPIPHSPSPLSFLSIKRVDDIDRLESFFTETYGESFNYDDSLSPNTYRRMQPYIHIYEFNSNGNFYLIKFSSDPNYKELIAHEWSMYRQIYTFENQSYFLKGVEGGEYKECSYTILPFVKAISLEASAKRLNKEDFAQILSTVADALRYLLSKGICHGDMHAGNILLTDDGVKIIDFDKAGPCDGLMNVGYTSFKGRKPLRKDVNFIGVPYNTHTGFFIMAKDLCTKKGMPTHKIDNIIDRYMRSNHMIEDIDVAYQAMKEFPKGGRRTRRRRGSVPLPFARLPTAGKGCRRAALSGRRRITSSK
jgi:serine/threonine protein kinase